MTSPTTARVSRARRHRGPFRLSALLAVSVLVVAACGDSDEGGGDIAGTGFALETLNGQPTVPLSDVTLNFENATRFNGNTGCNAFSGTYSTDGSSITLEVGPTTLALCGDEAMQQQEADYLAALAEATEYAATDNTLGLSNEAGDVVAGFVVLASSLADTSWTVTSYNNGNEAVVSVIAGIDVTANFGTSNDVTGFGGCNDYVGAYTTDGASITLTPLERTNNTCAPDVQNQQTSLLNAMINTATFSFVGANRMQFRSIDGALQVDFTRAPGG